MNKKCSGAYPLMRGDFRIAIPKPLLGGDFRIATLKPKGIIAMALLAAAVCLCAAPVWAQDTPPVMPKVQETALPPPVTLPAPPSAPSDVPNRPLTANEAAAIALRHQPNVTFAAAGVAAARGREGQARSGLLPSVVTSASYNNTSAVSSARTAVPTTTTGPLTTTTVSGYQLSANIRQLIFDFNHTRDLVRQAQAEQQSAGANLSRVQSDLVFQVKGAFYNYSQNTRLVSVNEANVGNRQSHLALAEARLKAGLGLPADVVRAQTAVADAILSLNLARNNASVSRVTLAQLLGIDPRTPIEISDTGEQAMAEDNVDLLVNLALTQRPEVIQGQANVNAAAYSVGAAKTTNSPAVTANVGWLQRGTSFPLDNNSLVYGVVVQWTPFDSGLTRGRVEEARANVVASQAQLDSARLGVVSDVSQAYLNLKTAEQRVVTADSEVANAKEAVRLTEGRYRAGLGTFLDVINAQTALLTANTNRVNAGTAVDQARAALAHAVNASFPTQAAANLN